MKTIAILTLTFLPGTAVASFFSMQMFNWSPGPGQSVSSPYLWIYFVVTIPLTGMVYAAWFWYFRVTQKHYAKKHEEGLENIEMKLRTAARTVTGTW